MLIIGYISYAKIDQLMSWSGVLDPAEHRGAARDRPAPREGTPGEDEGEEYSGGRHFNSYPSLWRLLVGHTTPFPNLTPVPGIRSINSRLISF